MREIIRSLTRKILKEFIITLCAGDSQVLTKVSLHRVIIRAEKYVSELPRFYFIIFNLSLLLFEYAVPPFVRKLRPFTKMTLEDRLQYFDQWQSSRFYYKRILFKMLTAVGISHLYSERRLLVSLGYEESMQDRLKRPMIAAAKHNGEQINAGH